MGHSKIVDHMHLAVDLGERVCRPAPLGFADSLAVWRPLPLGLQTYLPGSVEPRAWGVQNRALVQTRLPWSFLTCAWGLQTPLKVADPAEKK